MTATRPISLSALTLEYPRSLGVCDDYVATKYEVLVEHRLADDARGLLAVVTSI